MEWWQGFWGWSATTFLALVAAGGVVTSEVRTARNKPFVRWNAQPYGWRATEDDRRQDLIEVTNLGTATASLLEPAVRGAGLVKDHDFPIPATVLPGASFKFLVEAEELSSAHVLFIWHAPADRHMTIEWFPLSVSGALADEKLAQLRRSRQNRFRLLRKRQDAKKPIGPGGAAKRRIRGRGPKVDRQIRIAMELPAEPAVPPRRQ